MMKYIDVNSEQALVFAEQTPPEITSDECLIKVIACGVNRADLLQRTGKYPAPKGESPILGLEVSGTIEKLGDEVRCWQPGDKVFALVPGGGYGQYVKVKAAHLMALPGAYSFAQGAATAEVFLTAYQSLFTIAKLQPDESVLLHAGASGVGSAAIQLAKANGCLVTVTASSDEKLTACFSLGADHGINYKKTDFVAWAKQYQADGFDVILDFVGGDYLARNVNVVGLDGRIVMLAMLSGRYSEQLDIAKLLFKRINIHASTLRNRSDKYKTELVHNFIQDFYPALLTGEIKPVIDTCYSWQDADKAHLRMQNNDNIGKLILMVDG